MTSPTRRKTQSFHIRLSFVELMRMKCKCVTIIDGAVTENSGMPANAPEILDFFHTYFNYQLDFKRVRKE